MQFFEIYIFKNIKLFFRINKYKYKILNFFFITISFNSKIITKLYKFINKNDVQVEIKIRKCLFENYD